MTGGGSVSLPIGGAGSASIPVGLGSRSPLPSPGRCRSLSRRARSPGSPITGIGSPVMGLQVMNPVVTSARGAPMSSQKLLPSPPIQVRRLPSAQSPERSSQVVMSSPQMLTRHPPPSPQMVLRHSPSPQHRTIPTMTVIPNVIPNSPSPTSVSSVPTAWAMTPKKHQVPQALDGLSSSRGAAATLCGSAKEIPLHQHKLPNNNSFGITVKL